MATGSSFVTHIDDAHATNTHQTNPTLSFNQAESPLNTLIRRTSSRRVRATATATAGREHQRQLIQLQRQQQQQQNQMAYAFAYSGEEEEFSPQSSPHYDRNTIGHQSVTNEIYPTALSLSSTSPSGVHTPKTTDIQSLLTTRPTLNLHLNTQTSTRHVDPPLSSPLLHGRFLRDSVATTSSNGTNSYYDTSFSSTGPRDMRASTASSALAGPSLYEPSHSPHLHPNTRNQPNLRSVFQYGDDEDDTASEYRRRYFGTGEDDERSSMYSQATNQTARSAGPALRDSWRSTDAGGIADYGYYGYSGDSQEGGWNGLTLRNEPRRGTSLYGHEHHNGDEFMPSSGSPLPTVVVSSPSQNVIAEWSGEDAEPTMTPVTMPFPSTRAGRTPIIKPITANFSRPVRSAAPAEHSDAQGERVTPQLPPDMREQKRVVLERNARQGTRSPSHRHVGSPLSEGMSTQQPTQPQPPSMESLHPPSSQAMSSDDRSPSPVSLYSNYSYYPFDRAAPSPTGSQSDNRQSPIPGEQRPNSAASGVPLQSQKLKPQNVTEGKGAGPQTAEDYLQLGIQHHEANRLQESVRCFERSANEGGGCGVGMLMYGLALRHGWGCAKNEKMGFKWLRKAAECAVDDLERVRTAGTAIDTGAVQTELVLAIYEVGQCFFHGWGVSKDQKMGVSYYTVAARLGDGDAQGDLAFCLANGKGCKRDKKEAAKWYRRAVEQGQSNVGLAWIYKEKYQ